MISHKTLRQISVASFVFGGFLLLTYATQVYLAVWRGEFLPGTPWPRRFEPPSPLAVIFSPFAAVFLLTGLAFIGNGYVLYKYLRESELEHTKAETIIKLLTEDERKVFFALKKHEGQLTQKALSTIIGFTPVKTHRVLTRLERRKLIKTYPFGMTKKIILEKTASDN